MTQQIEQHRGQPQKDIPNNPWGELKRRYNLFFTPQGRRMMGKLAAKYEINQSHLIESVMRRIYLFVVKPSISEVVKGYALEVLAESTGVSLERWAAIAKGERPSDEELAELRQFLELDFLGNLDITDLMAIRERDVSE